MEGFVDRSKPWVPIVDSHNHVGFWSPDAGQSQETLMAKAGERGILGAAISDHYDPDCSMADGTAWTFDPQSYMETFYDKRRLPSKRQSGDPPGFLLGIEMGWMPEVSDRLHRVFRNHPFDFAIVSLHHFRNHDPYTDADQVYTTALHKIYSEVIHAIADSAQDLSEAQIVGHFDFFSRYAPERESKMLYEHAPEAFDRLFRIMVKNGQALEINVGTVNSLMQRKGYALQDAMPDAQILKRYQELGGQAFTICSDAHHEGQNGLHMTETLAYLEGLGITDFVWFEGGEVQRP